MDGQLLMALRGHTGVVWCARFTPNGARVVTASSDRTARFWIVEPRSLLDIADRSARPFTNGERQRFTELLETGH